ncbi:MAG: hypothetical protein LBS19_02915, partial [Clostridiales bacterium]|nr:hypothetical protein [Clostridiales bacterium]
GFLSAECDPGKLAAKEVYVDAASPWDVQMLPEIYEDFFMSAEPRVQAAEPVQAAHERLPELAPGEAELAEMYYGFDISDESKLQNQMEMLERKLLEKDRQIMRLENLTKEVENQRALIERLYKEKDTGTSENAAMNNE